jgi:hypothetical protein
MSMADCLPRRAGRTARGFAPRVEGLDTRALLSAGSIGHHLGPFLAAGTHLPRVTAPAKFVDPHSAIDTVLTTQLGPELTPIQQRVKALGTSTRNPLADQLLGQPLLHAVLSRQDTYTLLNAAGSIILPQTLNVSNGSTSPTVVTFKIPQQAAMVSLGNETSVFQILPSGSTPGYYVTIPTANILTYPPGSAVTASIQVPVSLLPPGIAVPSAPGVPTGPLSAVYTATAPVLSNALRVAAPRPAPNTPHTVPGLRLVAALNHNREFPVADAPRLLRALRVAVDRQVFNLTAAQQTAVSNGLTSFANSVSALYQNGAFQPTVPPAPPAPPKGPLRGTLEVSLGALRNLADVQASVSGLQIPGIGNLPGRFDVGYVFDRTGNFGLALTARGPLSSAPKNISSRDLVGGDVRIEFSNAPNLAALGGSRIDEGLFQGTALSSGLESSANSQGVSTFAASIGYASGFEFGTAPAFTQVIPLGNVYALIPDLPKA